LLKGPGGALTLVGSTQNALWFDRVESDNVFLLKARYGGSSVLAHDSVCVDTSLGPSFRAKIWFLQVLMASR